MLLFIKTNNITMQLKYFNPHRKKDFSYNIDFKRDFYFDIIKEIDNKFILNISWLRRVGKTTILKQIIDYLIVEKQISRKNILYYSFDDFGEIEQRIDEYKTIFNIDFFNTKQQFYIFLDEVQKVKNFQSKIKILYDLHPNIKFILSWSNSLFLQKKESLAGRIFEYKMNILSFQEFLRFKKLDFYLNEISVYEKEIFIEFEKYIFRQFIDIINSSKQECRMYVNELVNKIIKEDISLYFKIEYPDMLISIFRILTKNPWMLLDYKNFSNSLNIDQRTLEKYIYFLEEANLTKKIYNFSTNALKSERKLKKIYLWACSFYSKDNISWEIFENYIQNLYNFDFFWRVWDKEVDFIKPNKKNEIIAIEVKYKNNIKKNDFRWLKTFWNKFSTNKKIIISKNKNETQNDVKIISFLNFKL